ncbi:hypothetical protein ABT262_41090, partial [Amycolatopsis mediterranei]
MTTENGPAKPRRGELRIYLGAAPGVGKTFAMLGPPEKTGTATPVPSGSASSNPSADPAVPKVATP